MDNKLIEEVIRNVEPFEKPDMISIVNDCVYCIEHFKISAHKSNKSGNKYIENDYQFCNDLKNVFEIANCQVTKISNLGVDASLHYYKKNFLDNFNLHYKKIESYIQNIIEKRKINKIKVWFFIEDVSDFGTCIQNGDGIKLVLPINIKEINDLILSSSKLDGIVYGVYNGKNNMLHISPKNSIKEVNDTINYIDLDEELVFQNPRMISSYIPIKNN